MSATVEACFRELVEVRIAMERIHACLLSLRPEMAGPGSLTEAEKAKAIKLLVASQFNLGPDQLDRRTRMRSVAWPRQIAFWLIRHHTNLSLTEIAATFFVSPQLDHGTILHGIQRVEDMIRNEPTTTEVIRELSASIAKFEEGL